jgi:hypothetical protein
MADITTNTSNEIGTRLLAVNKISDKTTEPSILTGILSHQNQSLTAIGAALNKSTISTKNNNEGIVKALSVIGKGKVNKYTPITVELERIAETLGFISGKQLPLISEFMAKDNAQGMKAYDLESKALKYQHMMSKAKARAAKEYNIENKSEDGTQGGPGNQPTIKKKKGFFGRMFDSIGSVFSGITLGLFGSRFLPKLGAFKTKVLKIFGKAGWFALLYYSWDDFVAKLTGDDADKRITEMSKSYDRMMISLDPWMTAFGEAFGIIGDIFEMAGKHVGQWVAETTLLVGEMGLDVGEGFSKLLSGDIKGGLEQMFMGTDGKGGLLGSIKTWNNDAIAHIGGFFNDINTKFKLGEKMSKAAADFEVYMVDLADAGAEWVKSLIRPMLPDPESLKGRALSYIPFIPKLYEWVGYPPPKKKQNEQDFLLQQDGLSFFKPKPQKLPKSDDSVVEQLSKKGQILAATADTVVVENKTEHTSIKTDNSTDYSNNFFSKDVSGTFNSLSRQLDLYPGFN